MGEAGAKHDPEAREKNAGEEVEEGSGEPGIAMKLEPAREVEHRDGEEGKGIPVGEGREDGFAPGDLLGEVKIGGEGEGDGRPEKDEDGPAEFRFGCTDDWAIHKRARVSFGGRTGLRAKARTPNLEFRFCGWIKTGLMRENNDESGLDGKCFIPRCVRVDSRTG